MELETAEWLEGHLYDFRKNFYLLQKHLELHQIKCAELGGLVKNVDLMAKQLDMLYCSAKEDLEEHKSTPSIDDDKKYDRWKNEQREAV